MRLGYRERDPGRIHQAIDAFQAALEVRELEGQTLEWADLQNNMGVALLHSAEVTTSTSELDEAIKCFQAALAVFRATPVPIWIRAAEDNLTTALVRKQSSLGNP
jgi:tetratricopeptide (TPR) repeat protein